MVVAALIRRLRDIARLMYLVADALHEVYAEFL